MTLRQRTESVFEAWSEYVVQHCWLVLVLVSIFTGLIVPQIRHGTVDLSIESFLSKNDPSVAEYDAFVAQFGSESFGMVTVETKESVFTLENLQRLRALHEDLEANTPYLEEITSLVNVRHTRGEEDLLIVEELDELWPASEAELPAFRALVLSNPAYVGNLVSSNGRLSSVILEPNSYSTTAQGEFGAEADDFDEFAEESTSEQQELSREDYLSPDEEAAFSKALLEMRDRHQRDDFRIHVSGLPVANYSMATEMGSAMRRDMLLGLSVISVLLYLLFRRISGVLLPLLAVWLSMVVTLSLFPVFGYPFNGNTQILPTFLLAVGIADAVHILAVFYKLYDHGMEKKAAIIAAMKNTSIAVVMTTVTTAAGLVSFASSGLMPIRSLGVFGSIGVLLALYYTVALVPALLAVLPVRRRTLSDGDEPMEYPLLALIDRVIFALGDFGVRHARGILIFALGVSFFALAGVAQIQFSHDPLRWYDIDNPTRVAAELVDAEMSGAQTMQVILDTGRENGVYEPKFLELLDEAKRHIESRQVNTTHARQAISILSVVKETHKALNGGDEAFYRVPAERETVAQELLLFESSGADDIEDFTDSTFQFARFSVLLPFTNVIGYEEYIDTMHAELSEMVRASGQHEVTVSITGVMVVFARTLTALLHSTIKSYGLAFGMVGILMILLMGGLRRGMLAFTPNIIPILFAVGMMGWLGIPLNMLTSMVGCIVIGIAVDNTIHFMHHYRKISEQEPNPQKAVRGTLESVGRALTFTSIVLVGGFIVHILDEFSTSRHFGILLCFSIIIALLANLVLAPALMTTFWRRDSEP